MTITRTINGEEISIELTYGELCRAYHEEQALIDKDDVMSVIEEYLEWEPEYLDGTPITMQDVLDNMDDIMERYRHYRWNDESWRTDASDAISSVMR